jgi:uncharacterized Zn finger protein (UPF0148 family)
MEESLRRERCPSCASALEPSYLACPLCGTKVKDSCRRCRQPLNQRWVLCPYCGTKKTEAPVPKAPRKRRPAAVPARVTRSAPVHALQTEVAEP